MKFLKNLLLFHNILFILFFSLNNLFSQTTYDPLKDFQFGKRGKYICDGTDKCNGLKFSIQYPLCFELRPGNRPHVVQSFRYSTTEFISMITMVIFKKDYTPTKQEILNAYIKDQTEDGFQYLLPDGKLIKSQIVKIDGEDALMIDYTLVGSRLGTTFFMRGRLFLIYYMSYQIQILCVLSPSPNQSMDKINTENKFNNYYSILYNSIVNSFVLLSKWEN